MSAPLCDHCGSAAPYGDERNMWIGAHSHKLRRFGRWLAQLRTQRLSRASKHKENKTV